MEAGCFSGRSFGNQVSPALTCITLFFSLRKFWKNFFSDEEDMWLEGRFQASFENTSPTPLKYKKKPSDSTEVGPLPCM